MGCQEGGAHGHFRLAKPDVAADQAVHGPFIGHVLLNRLDGSHLVGGFLERKLGTEGAIGVVRLRKRVPLAGLAAGVDIQQLGRRVPHLLQRFLLGLVPFLGPQLVQRGGSIINPAVARDQVKV